MKEEGNWLVKGQNSAKDLLLVAILYLLGPALSRWNGCSVLRQNHRPCPPTPSHPPLLHLLQGNPAMGTSFYCNATRHTPSSRCWHQLNKPHGNHKAKHKHQINVLDVFSLSENWDRGLSLLYAFLKLKLCDDRTGHNFQPVV